MRSMVFAIAFVLLSGIAVPVVADGFGCADVMEIDPGQTGPVEGSPYFEGAFTMWIGDIAYTVYSQSANFGTLPEYDIEGALDVNRIMHRWRVLENNERMTTFDTGVIRATDDPNILDIVIHTTVTGGTRWDSGELILVGTVDLTLPAYIGESIRGVLCDSDRLDGDSDSD